MSVVAAPRSSPPAGEASDARALFLAGAIVLSSIALFAGTGRVGLALAPMIGAIAVLLVARLPVRVLLLALLSAVTFSDIVPQSLSDAPGATYYGPVHPLYKLFFENLDTSAGVGFLHFSATEAIYILLLVVVAVRALAGASIDRRGRLPIPNVMFVVLGLSLGMVIVLELWGIGRGGDVRQSLWQFRQLFWLPVVTLLFCHALRDEHDFDTAIALVTAAACLKVFFGLYYLVHVAWPSGMKASMMTSHNDSILFVTALMGLVSRCAHEPSWRHIRALLLLGTWLLVAIALNNRRIAFVSLFGCLVTLYLQLRGPVKRGVNRLLLRMAPLMLVYVLAGRAHPGGIFKPAALVWSVTSQKDESSKTRDIENLNLIHTLRQHRLTGSGWGHEYIELIKGDDISRFFSQYRYIAHNSVLWLWSIGGVAGFTLLWFPLCMGIFFARRSYLFASTPRQQSNAALVVSIIITFMVQAWGDMGTNAASNMLLAALALGGSARLAQATDAFPLRVRLLRSIAARPAARASISASQWPGA